MTGSQEGILCVLKRRVGDVERVGKAEIVTDFVSKKTYILNSTDKCDGKAGHQDEVEIAAGEAIPARRDGVRPEAEQGDELVGVVVRDV